jgi:hypothetical protein
MSAVDEPQDPAGEQAASAKPAKAEQEKPIEKIKADGKEHKPETKELKPEIKEHKPEVKEHKPEIKEHKPEIKEHKDKPEKEGKDKPEKEGKPEKEKLEGKEFKAELKVEKPEIKEHKEGKPEKEKLEGEEFKAELKVEKLEIKEAEKQVFEKGGKDLVEGPGQGPGGDPLGGIGREALLQHADSLVQAGQQLRHFIETSNRPDLGEGALQNEADQQGG